MVDNFGSKNMMKNFIKDCVLFQSKTTINNWIGVIIWMLVILFSLIIFMVF